MITKELSQNTICHPDRSEKSLICGTQTLRFAQGDSFEIVINSGRTRGFTLIEVMLAVTVLGFAAAGVLLPFASGAIVRAEGIHMTLGAELAADLMEQILRAPAAGYSLTEPQGQVKDASGVIFTDPKYANFSRKATCVSVTVPPAKCNFILITVQVDYSGRNVATLSRLVSE
jgi:prepilin-type N-terminal cleavage/methylation domain-containing protein